MKELSKQLLVGLFLMAMIVVCPLPTKAKSSGVDVTGTWKLEVDFSDGRKGTPTFTLKQEGEKLSGTYKGGLGEAPVEGTVKGNEVTITFKAQVQMDQEITVTLTGKVEGTDSMKGTIKATALLPEGNWVGKKQS